MPHAAYRAPDHRAVTSSRYASSRNCFARLVKIEKSGVMRRELSRRPASQFELPGFADQALAETAVRLGGDQLEAGFLIDFARGDENALGPQRDLAIAAGRANAMHSPTSRWPSPCPRPAGSTSSRRSFATSSLCRTRNTEPTCAPSISAIQQRSREASNEVRNFAAISATSASNEASKPYSRA